MNRPLLTILAVVVIIGSVAAIIIQVRQESEPPAVVETAGTTALGQALIAQACQAVGGQGTLVILSSEGINPFEYQPEALEAACQKALAQCPGLRQIAIVRVQFPTDDYREPVTTAFRDLLAKHYQAGAVISLLGVPVLPASELQPWTSGPALVVLGEAAPHLSQLVRAGVVRAAVVPRSVPVAKAATPFARDYEILLTNH